MKRKCLRPGCGRSFIPRACNAGTQQVCGLDACRRWYKRHHEQTAPVPRGVTEAEWELVEKALVFGKTMDTLILLARETALRKGELLGLTWGDVLAEDGSVRAVVVVRGQRTESGRFKVPKADGSRNAFLSVKARKWIAGLLANFHGHNNRGALLFECSHPYAWEWWTGLQSRLGLSNAATRKPYRFHDLRHTLGTELVKKGRLDLAQKALGHKNPATTMRYAERSPEELGAEIEKTRRGK